jgi:hypothetical protein
MEPRNEARKEPQSEVKESKPRRFRVIKLEERIAPGGGNGMGSNVGCHHHSLGAPLGKCGC